MPDFARDEFAALRATIRERGTARVWIFLATIVAWAAPNVALTLVGSAPVFTLVPLVVLAAGFEAVFQLHVGIERIGRYLQVFTENGLDDPGPHWETAAMEFGRGFKAVASDPLFTPIFIVAAFLNAIPALGDSTIALELATIGGAHLVFLARVILARRAAATQRDRDLARFQALRKGPAPDNPGRSLRSP